MAQLQDEVLGHAYVQSIKRGVENHIYAFFDDRDVEGGDVAVDQKCVPLRGRFERGYCLFLRLIEGFNEELSLVPIWIEQSKKEPAHTIE